PRRARWTGHEEARWQGESDSCQPDPHRANRMSDHVRLDDVVKFLDERLEVAKFDEVESNGLIVRASDVVTSVAAAVSTSFHAISRAKSAQADLLIVHHRSWPEIDLELVEEKHTRLRQNGISLYCAH